MTTLKPTRQVRIDKELWGYAESLARQKMPNAHISQDDVFKFVWNHTPMGSMWNLPKLGKKLNKRGSFEDVPYITMLVVVFAVMLVVGLLVANSINDRFQASSDMPTQSKQFAQNTITKFTSANNSMFIIFVVGLIICGIGLALMVRVSPVFIPIFFLAMLFMVWVCGAFKEMYEKMAADSLLGTSAAALPMVGIVMTSLPVIVTVCGTLIMIVMYKNA